MVRSIQKSRTEQKRKLIMAVIYGILYYICGLAFGVVREWSTGCLNETRLGREVLWWSARDFLAYFNFPMIGMAHFLHGRMPRWVRNATGEEGLLLELTDGGLLYWVIIAAAWPLCILWSVVMIVMQALAYFLWVVVLGFLYAIRVTKEWVDTPPSK